MVRENSRSFSTALAFSREGGRVVSGGRWRFVWSAVQIDLDSGEKKVKNVSSLFEL